VEEKGEEETKQEPPKEENKDAGAQKK